MPARVPFTMVTIPRAWAGREAVTQRNAIESWLRLEPTPEVLVLGGDPGVAEACAALGVRHIPGVACNEYGTPFVDDAIRRAEAVAAHDTICVIHTDIIMFQDLVEALRRLPDTGTFLLGGRRRDLDVPEPLDFTAGWDTRLRDEALVQGRLRSAGAKDYLVFPRGFASGIPPLVIGRPGWDSWLVAYGVDHADLAVDATESVVAVHQAHDHDHITRHAGGLELDQGAYGGPEADRNRAAFGGYAAGLDYMTHQLTPDGLVGVPPRGPIRIRALHPASGSVRGFNVQPSGLSAIAVEYEERAFASDSVVFDGERLVTLRQERTVTALVPRHLHSKPGPVEVWVADHRGESNRLVFTVTA